MKRTLTCSSIVVMLLGLLSTASAFNVVPTNPPLPESSVEATLAFMGGEPGSEIYRYDFSIRNISVEPAVQTVLVFFDSDPVTGEFLGDKSDLIEIQSPSNWEAYGFVDPDPAPWFVKWQTFSGPDRIFPSQVKIGFSVIFTWKDPETSPGNRFFEAMNGEAYEGETLIVGEIDESISICGTVHDQCATADLPPITVDLHNELGALIATTSTDENGEYCFVSQLAGLYAVSIVTPLGFVVDEESRTVLVDPGTQAQVDFWLACLAIEPSQRTIGYWKHQANALVMGKGKSQEGLDNMISYLHAIREHFNENVYNPVIVFDVDLDPNGATSADSLLALRQMLTVNQEGTMLDRAKQQMVALLLNVASLKLSQAEVISEDGANASQAITYCNEIITDQVPGVSYEVAKDIADIINNGGVVAAGVIPLDTEIIWYSLGNHDLAEIMNLYPNPFASSVSIRYTIPESGSIRNVRLEIYDIRGRMVYSLGDLAVTPGQHQILWEGVDHFGQKVASGTYFVNVRSDRGISSQKVTLIRSR